MYRIWEKIKGMVIIIIIVTSIFVFLNPADAHILVIGDSKNDYNQAYIETSTLSNQLKSRGYEVLELYKSNATAKNILKGMYDADAVIYAGHGGYQLDNYDGNGGNAAPPFALVGSDNFIWGMDDQMREGYDPDLFTAPFKKNIPVILLHSCFSTGWVENKEVANPIETIYNFARMFTGAGANFYATAWNGAEIVYDFMNGATDFADANKKNYEEITKSTEYNGIQIWRNDQGYAAFIGNWSSKFPKASETTPYDDEAAERWYNSDRIKNNLTSKFTIGSSQHYVNQVIAFIEGSRDLEGHITEFYWNFGDGNEKTISTPTNLSHTYTNPGTYTVTHRVTSNTSRTATSTKNVTVIDRSPVAGFYLTTNNFVPRSLIGFRSNSYDLDTVDHIISYNWNFGDGTSGSGEHVQHAYSKDGRYTVTLTVTDSFGKTGSKSTLINVITPKPDLVVTRSYKSRGYLYITVKNQGKATSGACYTRAWYGKYNKNIYTYGLKPGTSKTYKIKYSKRHGTVKVNMLNRISESNENNNLRYF